jgi:hypothetical protein
MSRSAVWCWWRWNAAARWRACRCWLRGICRSITISLAESRGQSAKLVPTFADPLRPYSLISRPEPLGSKARPVRWADNLAAILCQLSRKCDSPHLTTNDLHALLRGFIFIVIYVFIYIYRVLPSPNGRT